MKAIITGCILLAVTACSHTNRPPPQPIDDNAIESGAYRLQNTTTFSLDSKETGSTYNIAISFPGSYSSAQNTTTYPVIYVLDGQWQFPLVNTISGAVNYDGDMPEALVVGISWKETDGNLMALRERDLIHSASECATGSCNAIKFQNFLRNELFPHIETHYKGGAHRTVTGGSSSALFAIYTLLSQPTLFNGYIASSPSLWRENESINTIMENFPINSIANKTRLYISWGGLESAENIPRFAETLKRKKIPNLEVISAPVLNSGHAGVNAEGYTKGLQFVFQKPDLLLTQTRLNTLTGRYKSKDDLDDIQFIVKDKKLHAMFSDGQSFPLNASNESEFYIQGNAMTFTFNSQSNELRLNSRGTLFEFIRR